MHKILNKLSSRPVLVGGEFVYMADSQCYTLYDFTTLERMKR